MFLYHIFSIILDMSLKASFIITVVLIMRLALKKMPHIYAYALWSIVLFRLLCPFTFEAPAAVLTGNLLEKPEQDSLSGEAAKFPGAAMAAYRTAQETISSLSGIYDDYNSTYTWTKGDEVDSNPHILAQYRRWDIWIYFAHYIWLCGIFIMLAFSCIQYLRLRRRLVGAVRLRDNILQADHIDSPFVMGLIRPKIYLPSGLSGTELEYIILHEKHHIRRGDPFFRLLAFTALCLHWFNPLVWAAFFLSGKDMEMSCDEAVMRKMEGDIRTAYSESLLRLASGKAFPAGTPLMFGEGDTKARIANVMKFRNKKPAIWISVIAAVLCAGTVTVFLFHAGEDTGDTDMPAAELASGNIPSEESAVTVSSGEIRDRGMDSAESGAAVEPEENSMESSTNPATFTDAVPTDGIASWYADLDGDGTQEVIRLNVGEILPGAATAPWIEAEDGTRILDLRYVGLPHTGWAIFGLTELNGHSYLLEYSPYAGTGFGSISYSLSELKNGELIPVEQQFVNYTIWIGPASTVNDVDAVLKVVDRANEIWRHSRLLFSIGSDLHALYDQNGNEILFPDGIPEVMICREDEVVRYREDLWLIKELLLEQDTYDESWDLREILEAHNRLISQWSNN